MMRSTRSSSRGSAKFSRLRLNSKNDTKTPKTPSSKNQAISKYFDLKPSSSKQLEAEPKTPPFVDSQSSDDTVSDSPYKHVLKNDIYLASSANDEESDFKSPKREFKMCVSEFKVPKFNSQQLSQSKTARGRGKSKRGRGSKKQQNTLLTMTKDNFGSDDFNPEHLQMAIALSKSSYEAETGEPMEEEVDIPQNSTQVKIARIRSTLEQFGFKSKSDPIRNVELDRVKLKKKSKFFYITPPLLSRTPEDRQTILSSKINLILNRHLKQNKNVNINSPPQFKSQIIEANYNKEAQIFRFPYENSKLEDFYVKSLEFEKAAGNCGYLLKNWREILGRERSPIRDINSTERSLIESVDANNESNSETFNNSAPSLVACNDDSRSNKLQYEQLINNVCIDFNTNESKLESNIHSTEIDKRLSNDLKSILPTSENSICGASKTSSQNDSIQFGINRFDDDLEYVNVSASSYADQKCNFLKGISISPNLDGSLKNVEVKNIVDIDLNITNNKSPIKNSILNQSVENKSDIRLENSCYSISLSPNESLTKNNITCNSRNMIMSENNVNENSNLNCLTNRKSSSGIEINETASSMCSHVTDNKSKKLNINPELISSAEIVTSLNLSCSENQKILSEIRINESDPRMDDDLLNEKLENLETHLGSDSEGKLEKNSNSNLNRPENRRRSISPDLFASDDEEYLKNLSANEENLKDIHLVANNDLKYTSDNGVEHFESFTMDAEGLSQKIVFDNETTIIYDIPEEIGNEKTDDKSNVNEENEDECEVFDLTQSSNSSASSMEILRNKYDKSSQKDRDPETDENLSQIVNEVSKIQYENSINCSKTEKTPSFLNVTEYVNKILNKNESSLNFSSSVNSLKSLENSEQNKLNFAEENSKLSQSSSQESIEIISDEELNYSSHFSTPHAKKLIRKRSVLLNENTNFNLSDSEDESTSLPSKSPKKEANTNRKISFANTNQEFYDSFDEMLEKESIFDTRPKQNYPDNNKILLETQENNFCSSETEKTPNKSVFIKNTDVTPMPDYNQMNTPSILNELDKFGLKPLKRKKGVQLLEYIYNCTHPVIDNLISDDEENGQQIVKRQKLFRENPTFDNKIELIGDKILQGEKLDDLIFERKSSVRIHSCKVPLQIVWFNFLCCHPEIKENILLYEPIQLEVLHKMLKDLGFKFHIQDLLHFLDKKCITIRTNQGQSAKGKDI